MYMNTPLASTQSVKKNDVDIEEQISVLEQEVAKAKIHRKDLLTELADIEQQLTEQRAKQDQAAIDDIRSKIKSI